MERTICTALAMVLGIAVLAFAINFATYATGRITSMASGDAAAIAAAGMDATDYQIDPDEASEYKAVIVDGLLDYATRELDTMLAQ